MKAVVKIEDLRRTACAKLNPHLFAEPEKKEHYSKYRNKKNIVNGIMFDSKKEAEYYKKLLLLQKAGEIGLIEMQVPYELNPGGTHSMKYLADFVYMTKEGAKVVCDVKGFRTREYKKKCRLMKKVHNIKIVET
jgi:hypothetical protein